MNQKSCMPLLLYLALSALFAACGGGQTFGPITLRDMSRPLLDAVVSLPGTATTTATLRYDNGSLCGTDASLRGTLNGVSLQLVYSGGAGQYDHDEGRYQCLAPTLALPRYTRVPPNADGKHVLVVGDSSGSAALESTDMFAPVTASIRALPDPLYRGGSLTVG